MAEIIRICENSESKSSKCLSFTLEHFFCKKHKKPDDDWLTRTYFGILFCKKPVYKKPELSNSSFPSSDFSDFVHQVSSV